MIIFYFDHCRRPRSFVLRRGRRFLPTRHDEIFHIIISPIVLCVFIVKCNNTYTYIYPIYKCLYYDVYLYSIIINCTLFLLSSLSYFTFSIPFLKLSFSSASRFWFQCFVSLVLFFIYLFASFACPSATKESCLTRRQIHEKKKFVFRLLVDGPHLVHGYDVDAAGL